MIIASIKNITKIYDEEFLAVDNISFDIYAGEIMGFVGPNGAGKTTTIKMMLGLIGITSGNININGFDIKKDFEKAIRNVGSIVETPSQYGYLSGYDNMKLCSRMYGIEEGEIKRLVNFVGLTDRINDKVRKYSLGMKQRLGIAQAMLHKPSLLILDEPVNGLDPEGIKDFREMIVKLTKESNMSVLISSHILSEIQLMCDRIAIIDKGKLLKIISKKDEIFKDIYILKVADFENTISIISQISKVNIISVADNMIKLSLKELNTQDLITEMVSKGIRIISLEECKYSLELEYLETIGDKHESN